MHANYRVFIDRVIQRYEGSYGWNRRDAGGPTKYGITCFDYAEFRHQQMTSMATWVPIVKAMTLDEAEIIYETKYARGVRFDDLPSGIDCVMLDYGINSGVARSVRVARALCRLPAGTNFDIALLDAIKKYGDTKFINDMCDERLRFMHAIRGGTDWLEFGDGWSARVADLRKYCVAKAMGKVPGAAPDLSKVVTPKAINQKTKAGGTISTTGTVATGGGYAIHEGGFNWVWIVAAVVVVAALGVAYEMWKQHKVDKANDTPILTGPLPNVPVAA